MTGPPSRMSVAVSKLSGTLRRSDSPNGAAVLVKSSWMRTLAAALTLACAVIQPVAASGLLAGALSLELHASDHDHSLALVPDEGPLHLVLSHAGNQGRDPADTPRNEQRPTSLRESDHVLDLAGDDSLSASPRRVVLGDRLAASGAGAISFVPVVAPVRVALPSSGPYARSADRLRSVALRL